MKLDHCLFGYDDGHRLLASSLPLQSESSLLTELSDLAPGTVFGHSEGYWTGIPVPDIRRYALMRTWPAPEMSRPGCVWTHALLIEPALLESIEDLSVLQGLFIRPNKLADTDYYREQLSVDTERFAKITTSIDGPIARELIAALYGEGGRAVEVTSPGELDAHLFAVWSQQWPRLRRNFRFQTAASRAGRSAGNIRFDITVTLKQSHNATAHKQDSGVAWLRISARDLQVGGGGPLRRFLWSYGQDVRRQRSSFHPNTQAKDGQRLVHLIEEAFPGVDDARRLKEDIVDGVVVAPAQAELLYTLYSNRKPPCFPPLTEAGIVRLSSLWIEQSDLILRLAEIMLGTSDALGPSVLNAIAPRINATEFWLLTRAYPHIRPQLLVADKELELDAETLAELLPLVPLKTKGLSDFITQLISLDDERIATVAFATFPCMTARQVILAMCDENIKENGPWTIELTRRSEVLFKPEIMGLASSASLLFRLAESLGWVTPEVIATGVGPWLAAIKNVQNDLHGDRADMFHSFLIALALQSGGDDGQKAIELFFGFVHKKILKSALHGPAREILLPFLPELGWLSAWDFGRRFRLALARAYVHNQWPPKSYAALSSDRKVRAMLADAALETPGGKPYCDAIS